MHKKGHQNPRIKKDSGYSDTFVNRNGCLTWLVLTTIEKSKLMDENRLTKVLYCLQWT